MEYIPISNSRQYVSGIYIIESEFGKCYIGSAVKIKMRYGVHLSDLNKNRHDNKRLQNYFNKYGGLSFRTLELCPVDSLIKREQHYIDTLNPFFNICRKAGATYGQKPWQGKKHTDETKRKIRDSNIKTKGAAKKDRWAKRNKKISDRMKGNKIWLGRKHKKETIENRVGILNPNSRKVICGGIIFNTVKEAASSFGVGSSAIVNAIKRGNLISGKYKLYYANN